MEKLFQTVSCECGQVTFKAAAKPIVSVVCHCDDCQTAGDVMDSFDGIKPFRHADGGTPYVILHDKQWSAVEGQEFLEAVKLKPDSPTTRYVASCCRSPMFLKFGPGFWTSAFRERFKTPPNLDWHIATDFRASELPYEDSLPRFKRFPLRLYARLFRARLRAAFRA